MHIAEGICSNRLPARNNEEDSRPMKVVVLARDRCPQGNPTKWPRQLETIITDDHLYQGLIYSTQTHPALLEVIGDEIQNKVEHNGLLHPSVSTRHRLLTTHYGLQLDLPAI
jgi:hypothetical protein